MDAPDIQTLRDQLRAAEIEASRLWGEHRTAETRVGNLRLAIKQAEVDAAKASGKALHIATVRSILKKAGYPISVYQKIGRFGEWSSGAHITQSDVGTVSVTYMGHRYSRDEDAKLPARIKAYRDALTAAGLLVLEAKDGGLLVTRPLDTSKET